MCGEQCTNPFERNLCAGSSPRVRGTALFARIRSDLSRFIPACAGNSRGRPRRRRCISVHPRVCGEQNDGPGAFRQTVGSSPRVRGTAAERPAVLRGARFIPACAGNSQNLQNHDHDPTVHPRVCGEQAIALGKKHRAGGSSPRVRGTGFAQNPLVEPDRFIPACAGNSAPTLSRGICAPVHPRVCGEQLCSLVSVQICLGSSPRVRGTAEVVRVVADVYRFIPACAGNRTTVRVHSVKPSVHPRVCGEQRRSVRRYCEGLGSSPRVRGTADVALCVDCTCRFIPACAGNSPRTARPESCGSVHPRVCGEQKPVNPDVPGDVGSSPRVRGTALTRRGIQPTCRFIPACAGNRHYMTR